MISNYCRLCMAEEQLSMIDSFVLNALRNEFSIQIPRDDELSKEICKQCSEFVLQLIDFKKNVLNVQKVLKKMLRRKPNNESVIDVPCESSAHKTSDDFSTNEAHNDDNNVSSSGRKEEDEENQENINLITKVVKSIDLNEVSALSAAKLTWHPKGTFCQVCRVKLLDHYNFLKHVKSTSHAFKSHMVKKYGKPDIFQKYHCAYTCSICAMIFTNKKTLALHSREFHGVTISRAGLKPDTLTLKKNVISRTSRRKITAVNKKVSKSNGISSNERLLKEVDTNVKTESRDGVIIKTESNDETAGETVNPKRFPCKFCTKSFCFVESLSRHLRKHHPGKHLCIKCGFISVSAQLYSKHLRSHYNLTHNQRVCSDCFKICNDYAELYAHRKLVHDAPQSSFVCSECGETFVTIVQLKEHKRQVHWASSEETNRSNLRCKKCNRQFLSPLVLKLHQCTAKKFPCLKKCGQRFEMFSQMERHMVRCTKGHTIYTCMYCKKKLSCLQTFKNHLLKCPSAPHEERTDAPVETSVHESTIIDCNLCNISFQSEVAFEKHYEEFHKKLPENSKIEESTPRKVVSSSSVQKHCEAQPDNLIVTKNVMQNVSMANEKQPKKRADKSAIKDATTQNVTTSVPSSNAIAKKNYWRCKKCREKYFSITELESHFPSCPGIQTKHVKCHCGAIFVDKKILRLHKIVDHQGDKSVISKTTVMKVIDQPVKSTRAQKNQSKDFSTNTANNSVSRIEENKSEKSPDMKSNVIVEKVNPKTSQEKVFTEENVRRNSSLSEKNKNQTSTSKIISRKVDSKQKVPNKEDPVPGLSSIQDVELKRHNPVQECRLSPNVQIDDMNVKNSSTKQLDTYACFHCGLVFNSDYFLKKHVQDAHKSIRIRDSKPSASILTPRPSTSQQSDIVRMEERRQKYPQPSLYDQSMTKCSTVVHRNDEKCQEYQNPSHDRGLIESHGLLKMDEKRQEYQHPPHNRGMIRPPNTVKRDENRREYQQYPPSYDRNTARLSAVARMDDRRTEYQRHLPYESNMTKPYVKPNYYNNRYHPMNTQDRNNRSLSKFEKYDDPYRWRANRNNRIESSHNATLRNTTIFTGSEPIEIIESSHLIPLHDKSSCSANKNQLTITSNVSNVICQVCRNPNPHLFCTTCRTCYRENQVQYINHMKMKHSS